MIRAIMDATPPNHPAPTSLASGRAMPGRVWSLARALRHRNYRLFFFGQGLSLIGTWIRQTGEVWLAWRLTRSAMALGVVGGAAGTALGVLGIAALAPRADRMAPVAPLHVGGALLIALATGFLFSLYPAYQASRLDPVESLRYE